MKKLLIIILSVSVLGACKFKRGSGNIITEKRTANSFTGINVGGGFEVELKTGNFEVIVEADDNLMKYIETSVSNGQLRIRLDHINNLSDAHLKVLITGPEINSINSSGGAHVEGKGVVKSGESVELDASGGADIKVDLDAPNVSADASGGGEMDLSGRTKNLNATSSSGSTIDAKDLLSENTIANASSGGSVKVHASLSLDATASSGGKVTYRGGAVTVKKNVSSGGEVEKE